MLRSVLIFVVGFSVGLFRVGAEVAKDGYIRENNIPYRDKNSPGWDDYMEERCVLDLYRPAGKKGFSTVVWFHGGGLRGGNKAVPWQLQKKGIAVVAVNYRLFPKVKCPAYIEDAAAAIAWTFKNIQRYGGDPGAIHVSGHSAGGYLTSMVGLDKSYLEVHGIDADQIASLVPFSGHTITHFTPREERGIRDTRAIVDKFAPLFHVRKDSPRLVLITGDRELELLGRYEENAYLWRMMQVTGHKQTQLHELGGFDHGGMAAPAFRILLKVLRGR